jgi:hypothetical protein
MRRLLVVAMTLLLAGCADLPGVTDSTRARSPTVLPSRFCLVNPTSALAPIGMLQPEDLAQVSSQVEPGAFSSRVEATFSAWSQPACPAGQLSVGNSLLCDRLPDWLSHHALDGGGDGLTMSLRVITGGVEIAESVHFFDPPGLAQLAIGYAMRRCDARPPAPVHGFELYKLYAQDYPRWVAIKDHVVLTVTVTPDVPADSQAALVSTALTRAGDLLDPGARTMLLVRMGNWQARR